jgi:Matrixin
MSSFGIRIYLFTTLLLASILSLSVGNDYLFRIQGIVLVIQGGFSLQTAHAQEQDEETEDEEDEEPDNGDNNEEGDEEEDNGQTDTVGICCSWDERLADGVLTYRIIEKVGEDNDDSDEEGDEEGDEEADDDNQDEEEFSIDDLPTSDSDQRRIVTDAINEWNARIPNLRLVHEGSNVDADIEVQLVDGLGGMAAGATLLKFDEDGFINKVTILLPKAAFFIEGDSQVFAVQYDPQKLKEIATHELGHALGLGHADFDSDLMSERLNSDETMNISQCDVTGVLQANQWKLVNNDSVPNSPDEKEISC